VYDDQFSGKRPAVIVTHDWSGRNEFATNKADRLAEMGYIGFAIDMYGKGIVGNTLEEKKALITPLMENRKLLGQRMTKALETLKTIDYVDSKRIAAIGFCFGGLCVLDLARSGATVSGVVSFHGSLDPPTHSTTETISAKVLALHGFEDPMVSQDQVLAFQKEMTKAGADWQWVVYGGTMHAFTNPNANDPKLGTVYQPIADKRSWIAMKDFLTEIFA
jgi:dienelactone hydrolase